MYKKIKILIFFSFAVINCNAQFSSTDFIPYFDGSSWTYADRYMNLQFSTRYLKASLFNEGFGIVEKTKNTYVKINNLGEEVSKSSLEEYNKFNNVKVYYSTTGIVTDTGELGLGDMAFSTTSNVRQTSSKEVVVTKKGNKYGYEKNGTLIVPFIYEAFSCIEDKYENKIGIVKGKNNKWGIVWANDTLVQIKYDNIDIENKLAIVTSGKKYGIIDPFYLKATNSKNNIIKVFYDSYFFLITSDKDMYLNNELSVSEYGGGETLILKKNNLFGIGTTSESNVAEYNKIEYIGNQIFRVFLKEKIFYINDTGRKFFSR